MSNSRLGSFLVAQAVKNEDKHHVDEEAHSMTGLHMYRRILTSSARTGA